MVNIRYSDGFTSNLLTTRWLAQLTWLVGILLLMVCALTRADFTTAMENYQAKNYSEAMTEFKRLASLGHKQSQFNVGVMNFRGEGVEKNPVEAYAWMALATTDGDENRSHTRDVVMSKLDEPQKAQALTRTTELLKEMSDAALKEKLTPVLLSSADCKFQAKRIKMTTPKYPQDMLNAGKNGYVDVDYTIDKFGFNRDYSVTISSDKAFEGAIYDAIRYWRYTPTLVDGKPVEVT